MSDPVKHEPKVFGLSSNMRCGGCNEAWPCEVARLRDDVEVLTKQNWQLRQACGYPIPAGKETIDNPFKCGVCDARKRANEALLVNAQNGSSPKRETYLGDGLYAAYDGWQITLRAPREGGDHWVAIEPEVLLAFIKFSISVDMLRFKAAHNA